MPVIYKRRRHALRLKATTISENTTKVVIADEGDVQRW